MLLKRSQQGPCSQQGCQPGMLEAGGGERRSSLVPCLSPSPAPLGPGRGEGWDTGPLKLSSGARQGLSGSRITCTGALSSLGLVCESLPGNWGKREMNSVLIGRDSKTVCFYVSGPTRQLGSARGRRTSCGPHNFLPCGCLPSPLFSLALRLIQSGINLNH